MLEWASKDKESAEEGCLSLPGVSVEVERPVHVLVRAQDERGKPILVEASGLEARVIQHEMDHLDGVLILDRTSRDQRKQAMRALREALDRRGRRASLPGQDLCATSISARRSSRRSCSRALAESDHRPRLVVTRPDAKQGRGQKLAPPPVAVLARELGIEVSSPSTCMRRGARADRRRASPRCSPRAPTAS